MKMNYALVLVAGGIGERSQQKIPKQFVEINQTPVIIHSLNSFLKFHSDLMAVIVCHPNYINVCQNLIQKFFSDKSNIFITKGGETRFHSVKNGLEFLQSKNFSGIVAVHDAARPCLSQSLIQRCFKMASEKGNAIPSIPLNESIRIIKNNENTMADRSQFVIIQTPQCAEFSILYKAFQQKYQPIFTDEANVLETFGEKINLCEGEKNNIKITYLIDFEIARLILEQNKL
jgi:2-C-methyl-D-erythritol 4-phosphate cytidylyltransferase